VIYFIAQLRSSARCFAAAIPGAIAFLLTSFAELAHRGAGPDADVEPSARLAGVLVTTWIVTLLLTPRSPMTRSIVPWCAAFPAPPPGAALVSALAGSIVGAVAWACIWLPVENAVWRGELALIGDFRTSAFVLAAAAACALVTMNAVALLPRAAAVVVSGTWLFLSSRPTHARESTWLGLADSLLFPVSPGFLAAEEASQPGLPWGALAGVAAFDVGLFLLLVASELRRRR
jgi:hypothetical protein